MSTLRSTFACTTREVVNANARDYLANERTLMAHARTAFAFIGLGVGIASTLPSSTHHRPAVLGLCLVLLGALLFLYATPRYYVNMISVQRGVFHPDYITPFAFSTAVVALAVFMLVLVTKR